MSIFVHRCTECGHACHEHAEQRLKGRSCSFGWCPCSQVLSQVRAEPSELIPRFRETGEVVAEIAEPGARLVANPQAGLVSTCDCDTCRAAYAAAVGGAA